MPDADKLTPADPRDLEDGIRLSELGRPPRSFEAGLRHAAAARSPAGLSKAVRRASEGLQTCVSGPTKQIPFG